MGSAAQRRTGAPRVDTVRVIQHRFHDEDPAYSKEEVIASIGKPNMSRMINNICAFEPRNALILQKLKDIVRREPLRKVRYAYALARVPASR